MTRFCVGRPAAIGVCNDAGHGELHRGASWSNFLGEIPGGSVLPSLSMTPVGLYCQLCGKELPAARGAGRPKQYCSPECGEIASLTARLETVLSQRVAQIRSGELPLEPRRLQALSALRSRLWSLANLINAAGRPVASPTAARRKAR